MKVKEIIIGLYLACLQTLCQNIFCSAYCAPNACTDITRDSCSGCDPPYELLGTTCFLDPTSNYEFLADENTPDLDCDQKNLINSCSSYQLHGSLLNKNVVFLYPAVSTPHYSIRLIMWVLLSDTWAPTDDIFVQNRNTGTIVRQSISTISTTQNLCSDPTQADNYMKLDVQLPHFTMENVNIKVNDRNTNNNPWGVKQYHFLIRLCHLYCYRCTGPTNTQCSQCNDNYWRIATTCNPTCPPSFFPHTPTKTCRDCAAYCVTATLTLSGNDESLTATLTFSQSIDFSNFPIDSFMYISSADPAFDISRFATEAKAINSRVLTVELRPTVAANMTDILFYARIYPKTINHMSIQGNYFSDTIYSLTAYVRWNVILTPQMTERQEKVIEKLKKVNDRINKGLGQKWVQQLKKTGVFAFLFSGAQLCSTVILCNTQPARNMYEGARFWASFIYFEVPQWEEDSSLNKYVVSQNYKEIVGSQQTQSRLLQAQWANTDPLWRLGRTGHTSYLLIDVYIQCVLLVICWIMVLFVNCYNARASKKMAINRISIIYNIMHKMHEIALFYIATSVVLEAITFSSKQNTSIKYVSFGLSMFAILYFLVYHTYIFYRLIPFTKVHIGSLGFTHFVEKYSYFLRDLRFDEYPALNQWTFRHIFRPYSYVVVGYVRLILIVTSLPLFQQFDYACIVCLTTVQVLEILRFFLTWPFHSLWRNIYRAVQQFTLLIIFSIYLVLDCYNRQVFNDLNKVTQSEANLYFSLGWAGFLLFFFYNFLFIFYQIIDIVVGCKYSNWQRMEFSRKEFYEKELSEIEEKQHLLQSELSPQKSKKYAKKGNCWMRLIRRIQGCDVTDQTGNRNLSRRQIKNLIKKGNLDNKNFDELSCIRIMVEEFIIRKTDNPIIYELIMEKVPAVFMKSEIDVKKKNNLLIPQRSIKKFEINKYDPSTKAYFTLFEEMYEKSGKSTVQKITLRTFVQVDQNLYRPNQQVSQAKKWVSHTMSIVTMNGSEQSYQIRDGMDGFPIDLEKILRLPRG